MKVKRKLHIIVALMSAVVMLVSCAKKVSEADARALVTKCMDDITSWNMENLSTYFTEDSDISEFESMDLEDFIREELEDSIGKGEINEMMGEENYNDFVDSLTSTACEAIEDLCTYEITGCKASGDGVDVIVEFTYPSSDSEMDADIDSEEMTQYMYDSIGASSPEEIIEILAERKGVTLDELAAEYSEDSSAISKDMFTYFMPEIKDAMTELFKEAMENAKENADYETDTIKLRVISEKGEPKIASTQSELSTIDSFTELFSN